MGSLVLMKGRVVSHEVSGRIGLSDYGRRQLLYLDAARSGDSARARCIVGTNSDASLWRVAWATGTDLDPRLCLKLHTPAMRLADLGVMDGRLLVAISTCASVDEPDSAGEQLQLWDAERGLLRVLLDAPATCLSFADLARDPVLVTGHDGGLLRIWNLPDGSLRHTLDAGEDGIDDIRVLESNNQTQLITLDHGEKIVRWHLDTGKAIGTFGAPNLEAICVGQLSDGRDVIVAAGDGLLMWDLESGQPVPVTTQDPVDDVVDLVLSQVSGRDVITIQDANLRIATYDLHTSERIGDFIDLHRRRYSDLGLHIWSHRGRRARLVTVSEMLAVPTRGRVHLWNVLTSQNEKQPLAGPVAQSVVRAVRWRERDLLLTGSAGDGVVALWDVNVPVDPCPGHDDRVGQVTVVDRAHVVVSVDERGTICHRSVDNGALESPPLKTGVENVHALVAWQDGNDTIAATGAGSRRFPDDELRRWNLTKGHQFSAAIRTNEGLVQWISQLWLGSRRVLASVGIGASLKIWDASDGQWLGQRNTPREFTTGFATGLLDGRPIGVLSARRNPIHVIALDEELLVPLAAFEADGDVVIAFDGTRVITGHFDEFPKGWRTVRAWDLSGEPLGPGIRSESAVTAVALALWPHVYIARVDGTVSLSNLETGQDVCPRMMLPRTPKALAVTSSSGVIVGFGADLAHIHPPTELLQESSCSAEPAGIADGRRHSESDL